MPKLSCLKPTTIHQTLTKATTPVNRPTAAVFPREGTPRRRRGSRPRHPDPGTTAPSSQRTRRRAPHPHLTPRHGGAAPTPSPPGARRVPWGKVPVPHSKAGRGVPGGTRTSAAEGRCPPSRGRPTPPAPSHRRTLPSRSGGGVGRGLGPSPSAPARGGGAAAP